MAELLDALEAVPEDEREGYLERACPDPELRREVLALLAVEPRSTGYLDRFVGFVEGMAPKRAEPADLTGKRIGAYRLLWLLGRGGMGVVYEAERADGAFEQRVALKLLTTALAGTEAHDRFLAERRILAGLKHPAIAHIVDGGITEDGTPWFAMEHVEGEPIDAYCDRRRLGVRERLGLFLQVCDAVEHAHRRLVVHRDLKPSNVLVTEDVAPSSPAGDGGASLQVKLLDFGIARLLEPEETAPAAPPTRTALRLMTPEYASPEQVRGESVTTASDVYQLGLVLYELLTGHRPYALRRRSASEIERVICNQVPTRLSAAIVREDTLKPASGVPAADTRPAETSAAAMTTWRRRRSQTVAVETAVEEVCRVRSSSLARLRRRLRGDLENIVATALSKEPERRYGSADRLAQDIRRHLEGLPVTARADTWFYRGRKFLERHTVGATAAALVLAFAVGMTSIYTARIQSERDRAESQRDRAEAEAAKAQEVSRFLAGLFQSADPREDRGAETTVREALDRGAEQVGRELAAQPEVQAEMLHVLGRTYLELGIYDSAESLLTRALDLRRHRLGPGHPDVAETLGDFGLLRYRQGKYERARGQLEKATSILEASRGGDVPELAAVLEVLGQVYRSLGEHEKGQTALERALSIQRRASGEDSVSVASILHRMGALQSEINALERAAALYERALAIYERELGADHPVTGGVLMDLANTRVMQGELDGVETMYRRNLSIQERTYGPTHARVGEALNNLGHLLTDLGRNDEAIEALQRSLEVLGTALGPDHPALAYSLASLGDAHLAGGRLREAWRFYQRGVTVREAAIGVRQFDAVLAHSLVRLGGIEAELGNRVAAEQVLNRALALWRHAPEAKDPRLVPTLTELGRWLAEQQRCAEAMPLLQRAHQLQTIELHPASPELAALESLLADCP